MQENRRDAFSKRNETNAGTGTESFSPSVPLW
jgi:hypothetical protein